MEHRWGVRVACAIGIKIRATEVDEAPGTLIDLSLSGALIQAPAIFRIFTLIQVIIATPAAMGDSSSVAAYVVRRHGERLGIEWCSSSPRVVAELLRRAPQSAQIPVFDALPLQYVKSSTPDGSPPDP